MKKVAPTSALWVKTIRGTRVVGHGASEVSSRNPVNDDTPPAERLIPPTRMNACEEVCGATKPEIRMGKR